MKAEEGLAVGVESVDFGVDGIEREMIPAFAVLGLVIDRAAVNFHLAGGEVALEVRSVIKRVVQTPFHKGDERNLFFGAAGIGQGEHLNFGVLAVGNHVQDVRLHIVL